MLYKLGRGLQFAALIILPLGVAGEVAGKLTLKEELTFLLVGVAVFAAGWLVQQGAKPP